MPFPLFKVLLSLSLFFGIDFGLIFDEFHVVALLLPVAHFLVELFVAFFDWAPSPVVPFVLSALLSLDCSLHAKGVADFFLSGFLFLAK